MILDEFVSYIRAVYHTEPNNSEQIKQLEMSFFGGASAILGLISNNVSTEPGCTDNNVKIVEDLFREITEFSERKKNRLE